VQLPAPRHHYTFDEYLDLEDEAAGRHEFYQGEIYAMAGGTPEHAAMAAAIQGQLALQLEASRCRAYSSDLRVRILGTGLATYPDVTVVCGPSERDPESPTHITNPKLVVEVLSPSTAHYDRHEKLQHYQQVSSLDAVVLVAHDEQRVDLWLRSSGGWEHQRYGAGDTIPLAAIGCSLAVDPVYAAARDA
jgi:Uma2 family endonuclease